MRFNILADENIVLVREIFSPFGDINLVDGYRLNQEKIQKEVATADILLIRSVTQINSSLLSNLTSLTFIGSATTGTDHVDHSLLGDAGIGFAHAPGSNADSVVEYVLAAVASTIEPTVDWGELCVGVIGYGTIGSRVAARFAALGCSVIASDPPLEKAGTVPGSTVEFRPLHSVLEYADIITFHVPLVHGGEHPTVNLIGRQEASLVQKDAVLINTSRGQVVTSEALTALAANGVSLVLDVWPNEPDPDAALVKFARLATPHIAGYSYDGKVLGSVMIRDALVDALELPATMKVELTDSQPSILDTESGGASNWRMLVHEMYDIEAESKRFKTAYLESDSPAEVFISQRKNYPKRRSFSAHSIRRSDIDAAVLSVVEDVLRVQIVD